MDIEYGPHEHTFTDGSKCDGTLRPYTPPQSYIFKPGTQLVIGVRQHAYDQMVRCDKCGIAAVIIH